MVVAADVLVLLREILSTGCRELLTLDSSSSVVRVFVGDAKESNFGVAGLETSTVV